MEVSVIVPTYNGAAKIIRLLEALNQQTYQAFELILVLDGSIDSTLEVLREFKSSFRKTIVSQTNQGRSRARNNGAKHATGRILIFYDDDVVPAVDSVKKHLEFHSGAGGILSGNPVETLDKGKTDIQNYKALLATKWTQRFTYGINEVNEVNLFFTSANCSLKRDDFLSLNGFDEKLTDAEDYDLAMRAIENGHKVFFDKTNTVIHNDPITCRSYVERQRQYVKAHDRMWALHPNRIRSQNPQSLFKQCIYRLFAFGFWPFWIDECKWLTYLPKRIRYRVYDLVIQALGKEYTHIRLN